MPTATPKKITLQDIDLALASRSFLDFLDHVKILEPPTATSRGGIIAFERWDHIEEVCVALSANRLVNFLKSRQLGFSWLLAAYCLWTAQFKEVRTF